MHHFASYLLKGIQTMAISLSLGLLILRLGVGLTIAAHGAQKLFGWFEGSGLTKLTQGFEKHGFWNSKRGLEFPLALLTMGVGIGIIGPGSYSLDALFGLALPETLLFLVLAVAAVLVDVVGLIISRPAAVAPTEVKPTETRPTEVKSSTS